MMEFIFRTTATMKPYNSRKWWIAGDIVSEKRIAADDLNAAIEIYRERVQDEHYVAISAHAIKNKSPMYIDAKTGECKQVGYVITGKSDFEDRDAYKWSSQYIDLWVTVLTVVETVFPERDGE